MNRFIYLKGLQKSSEIFNESKAAVTDELSEHYKKLTHMDEHTFNIYKMGCKYALELLQYQFIKEISKEQTKTLIQWEEK